MNDGIGHVGYRKRGIYVVVCLGDAWRLFWDIISGMARGGNWGNSDKASGVLVQGVIFFVSFLWIMIREFFLGTFGIFGV
jgi:hypothetical protein